MTRRFLEELHRLAASRRQNIRVLHSGRLSGQAGDTAEDLARLLECHAPSRAPIHVVLGVGPNTEREMDRVQEVLDQRGHPCADGTPVDPRDHEGWVSMAAWFDTDAGGSGDPPWVQDPEGFTRELPERVQVARERVHQATTSQVAARANARLQDGRRAMLMSRHLDAVQDSLNKQIWAEERAEQETAVGLPKAVQRVFNTLQLTPHWQAQGASPAATALRRIIERLALVDEDTQTLVSAALYPQLEALADFPPGTGPTGQVFDRIASALESEREDVVVAVMRGHMACLKVHIGAGLMDEHPEQAARFALAAFRYDLLEHRMRMTVSQVRAADLPLEERAMLEADFRRTYYQAFDGVTRGQETLAILNNPKLREDPVTNALRLTWNSVIETSRTSFEGFLAASPDWQAMRQRRQRQRAGH